MRFSLASLFRLKTMDSLVVAKACAIYLLVANHSLFTPELMHGGVNVLLFISGVVMATFAFNTDTAATIKAMLRFAMRLVLPALAMTLVWQIAFRQFDLTVLLMFSNWLRINEITPLPIWYVQAMAQMLAGLSLVFFVFDLTPKWRSAPVAFAAWALVLSVLLATISRLLWNTDFLDDQLPHLHLWNFVLGWVYLAATSEYGNGWSVKAALSLIVLVSAFLGFIWPGTYSGLERMFWMPAIVLPAIWFPLIPMPWILAHLVYLISQATLYIFMGHVLFFQTSRTLWRLTGLQDVLDTPTMSFFFGAIGPVLVWVLATAALRAYRRTSFAAQSRSSSVQAS